MLCGPPYGFFGRIAIYSLRTGVPTGDDSVERLPVIASSEHATIEARLRRSSSVCLLSLISRMALETNIPCFCVQRAQADFGGEFAAVFAQTKSSRPATVGRPGWQPGSESAARCADFGNVRKR